MGKRLTNTEFINRVFDSTEEEYTFLEKYTGMDNKLSVKHNLCGYEYQVTPYHFLHRKQRCPNCNKYKKKSPGEFKKEFEAVLGKDYKLLSEYKGARESVTVKHNLCGSVYKQVASESINGKGCLKCARASFFGSRLKSKKDFENEFNLLSKGEYKLLSEYLNDNTKIKIKHNQCGFVYEVSAGSFLQGRRCRRCGRENARKKQTWTQEYFEKLVTDISDGQYKVIGNYVKSQIKIKMRHLSCGNDYDVTPRDFVQGRRCPRCNQSHGEAKIEEWLKSKKYIFEKQFKFNDCRVERPLPFDFAIFKSGDIYVVEYQGIQHYQPVSLFGGDVGYEKRVVYDNIKRSYCQERNIRLIEIPYYYDDEKIFNAIEEILCQS